MKYLLLILIFLSLGVSAYSESSKAVRLTIDGAISPATVDYVKRGIFLSEQKKAQLLIITLDTPGGLLESTRQIVGLMLKSKVPTAVYVSPEGSRAGSAGVFITLAANIAAMSPGTNIGAAHPVNSDGSSPDNVMNNKITNDACAFIRSIAEKRGKNPDWAEKTVRYSISSSEHEALNIRAIDFIANNFTDLLNKMHGMTVKTNAGEIRISSKNAEIIDLPTNWREEILSALANPNIAYILLLIGIYGIMFELWNPGAIFPGSVGGIALLLAAYSFQMLPVNMVGIGLIVLSTIFFILEVKVTSYGLLTIGGIVTFSFGSILLIDSPFESMHISLSLIIAAVIFTALFFTIIITFGLKAQLKQKTTGQDALIGAKGVAVIDFRADGKGKVRIFGEIWKAVSKDAIYEGDGIKVISVSSFTLNVEKTTSIG